MTLTINQTVLVVGGATGIGEALALKFAHSTAPVVDKVFITGRNEATLAKAASAHPKLVPVVLDPNELDSIPSFVERMVRDEGVTYAVLNAGMALALDFTKPAALVFSRVLAELNVNLVVHMKFTQALISAFNDPARLGSGQATIAVTTSGIALTPFPHTPLYSASKAGLRAFLMAVREQLYALPEGENRIKLIDYCPPAVKTDFYRRPKSECGMDVAPFGAELADMIDETFPKLAAAEVDEIGYGTSIARLESIGKLQWEYMDGFMGRAPAK